MGVWLYRCCMTTGILNSRGIYGFILYIMRKTIISILIIGLLSFAFIQCTTRDKKPQIDEWDSLYGDTCDFLFEYVYVDKREVLHAARTCFELRDSMSAVLYIDTLDLRDSCFMYYCPNCVSNKRAKHIKNILRRHKRIFDYDYSKIPTVDEFL